ncbi:restriction endonuclease subunit S [Cytobacillus firmus]|nr:restriction endonuclease subunit S [Cytobacillus firmus]
MVLKPSVNVSLEYLQIVLEALIETGVGTSIKQLTVPMISPKLIPIPPREEQNRIVMKVKKLLGKIKEYDIKYSDINYLNELFPINLERSILQYALQGKLVKQDLNDEPALHLKEKIQLEKEQLIKDKVIKKDIPFLPISEEEIPFDIPSTWEWVRLGEICSINPRNSYDDEMDVGFIPMKLIEDGIVNKHTNEIRKWKEIKKGYTHFQEEDIVVAKITPCFENQKSAVIKNLPNGIGAGTTELFVFRPYSRGIEREYLLYIFKSSDFINGGKKSFTGTAGQQRVSKNYIENYLIPLPPHKEQTRIVQAIKDMMGLKERLQS